MQSAVDAGQLREDANMGACFIAALKTIAAQHGVETGFGAASSHSALPAPEPTGTTTIASPSPATAVTDAAAGSIDAPLLPDRRDAAALWQEVLAELQAQMVASTFDNWLRNTSLVGYRADPDGNEVIVVSAQSSLAADWLANRLYQPVKRAVALVLGRDFTIEFVSRGPAT